MNRTLGLFAYWRLVFSRAFVDTKELLRIGPRTLIGIAITLLAAAALAHWFNPDKAKDKLIWAALTLAAEAGIFLIVLLVFLVRTPYRLHLESTKAFDAEADRLESAMSSLENEKTQLTQEVKTARTSNPKANLIRGELEKLLARFRRLIARLKNSDHGAVEEFYSVDMAAKNLVDREFSAYSDYAVAYPFTNVHTTKPNYNKSDFEHLIRVSEDRIMRLEELLGHFN